MSMNRVRHIFTYGTLMSTAEGAMGAAERALMERHAKCLGTTRLRGTMYDAGACPGLVFDPTSSRRVWGEVWQLPEVGGDLLAALDAYEGCAPSSPLPHSYARCKVRVRQPSGQRVTAWIYLWIRSTDGLPLIADGRWRGASRNMLELRQPRVVTTGVAA